LQNVSKSQKKFHQLCSSNLKQKINAMQSASTMGQRISELREKREISQAALARAIGVSPTAISKLESGDTRMLRADHLLVLASELGVNPYVLVFGEEIGQARKMAEAFVDSHQPGLSKLMAGDRRLLTKIIEVFLEHRDRKTA
jgi:transcriptional regulator with XRE-family HTH domain